MGQLDAENDPKQVSFYLYYNMAYWWYSRTKCLIPLKFYVVCKPYVSWRTGDRGLKFDKKTQDC